MTTTLFPLGFLPDVGGPELLLIFFAILILFGGQRLPELARGLGKSIREFKKASAGVEEEIKRAIESAPEPAPKAKPVLPVESPVSVLPESVIPHDTLPPVSPKP